MAEELRSKFEGWVTSKQFPVTREGAGYAHPLVQAMWDAARAMSKQLEPAVQPEPTLAGLPIIVTEAVSPGTVRIAKSVAASRGPGVSVPERVNDLSREPFNTNLCFRARSWRDSEVLRLFSIKKVNLNCWKVYLSEHFLGSFNSAVQTCQWVNSLAFKISDFAKQLPAKSSFKEQSEKSEAASRGPGVSVPAKCPTCDSPKPELHPAMQADGGEVQICRDQWHAKSPPPFPTCPDCGRRVTTSWEAHGCGHTALDVIREALEKEQERIGQGHTNQVTEALQGLMVSVALAQAKTSTRKARSELADAENIPSGLMEMRLKSVAAPGGPPCEICKQLPCVCEISEADYEYGEPGVAAPGGETQRGIGREEAGSPAERQRPSKPHNEGSSPSSPTIFTITLEPRSDDYKIWVARCLETGWVATGAGKDEARQLMLEIIDREHRFQIKRLASGGKTALKRHLIYEAYVSLLKRAEDFDEKDWERAGKFERHAINAALDIRDLSAELAAAKSTQIPPGQKDSVETSAPAIPQGILAPDSESGSAGASSSAALKGEKK